MTELDNVTFQKAIHGEQPAEVDFWASWCMPCKIFAPVLDELSDELDGKADFYKLNIDDYGDLAQKYGITSIPTVIVFKNGEAADRMTGVQAKEKVLAAVEKHL